MQDASDKRAKLEAGGNGDSDCGAGAGTSASAGAGAGAGGDVGAWLTRHHLAVYRGALDELGARVLIIEY